MPTSARACRYPDRGARSRFWYCRPLPRRRGQALPLPLRPCPMVCSDDLHRKVSALVLDELNLLGVSLVKWLMATTTGRPKRWMFSMCFLRFSTPCRALRRWVWRVPSKARRRAVSRRDRSHDHTALGLMPDMRHLMFMNFSAPKSAPKPASVTVYSESRIESFVARMLLQRGRCWRTGRRE